jgi:hypothetical protein
VSAPGGMGKLAGAVNAARRELGNPERPKFLVLRCGEMVASALAAHPAIPLVPPPVLVEDRGASYRQVGLDVPAGMEPGAWQLLEDGETIASGELGP